MEDRLRVAESRGGPDEAGGASAFAQRGAPVRPGPAGRPAAGAVSLQTAGFYMTGAVGASLVAPRNGRRPAPRHPPARCTSAPVYPAVRRRVLRKAAAARDSLDFPKLPSENIPRVGWLRAGPLRAGTTRPPPPKLPGEVRVAARPGRFDVHRTASSGGPLSRPLPQLRGRGDASGGCGVPGKVACEMVGRPPPRPSPTNCGKLRGEGRPAENPS
jgi:hypothetical protein